MTTEYLTPKEIAELLRVSYDNALEFIKFSGIPYVKVGRQYRVSTNKLENFLYPKPSKKISFEKRKPTMIYDRSR